MDAGTVSYILGGMLHNCALIKRREASILFSPGLIQNSGSRQCLLAQMKYSTCHVWTTFDV